MIETDTLPKTSPRAAPTALPPFVTPATLVVLGLASAGLYWWGRDLHRFTQWLAAYSWLFIGQLAIYVVACFVVFLSGARSSRAVRLLSIGLVLVFAAAFRVELVAERPFLSSDVYRYVWDGRVQASGVNPYRYPPGADELRELRDERIYLNITTEDQGWLSPYPPAAQVVFFVSYKLLPSVTGFKLVMSLFDLIAVVLIMLALISAGLDPARAIVFAWHPLLIFETAHSGHVESAYIAFIALALWAWSRKRPGLTGAALAIAATIKFYPALLLPVFLTTASTREGAAPAGSGPQAAGLRQDSQSHRLNLELDSLAKLWSATNLRLIFVFIATIVAVYLPYLGAGGNLFGFLAGYVSEEGFADSGARYFLLALLRKAVPIPTVAFLISGVLVLLGLAFIWLLTSKRDVTCVARGGIALVGGYLILTTPRYAWYYAWLLPFLCFAPRIGWLYLTGAASLLYLVWYTPLVYPEVPLWLGSAVYLPTIALLVWESVGSHRSLNTGR